MTYKMYLHRKKCKNTQINKNIFKQQKLLPPPKKQIYFDFRSNETLKEKKEEMTIRRQDLGDWNEHIGL